jgi:hypothetical protein
MILFGGLFCGYLGERNPTGWPHDSIGRTRLGALQQLVLVVAVGRGVRVPGDKPPGFFCNWHDSRTLFKSVGFDLRC